MSVSEYIIRRAGLDTDREPPYLFPGDRWGWLPDLCNEFGFQTGAEIGVSGGRFTERMCRTVPGLKMFAVDPWECYDYYQGRETQAGMDRTYRKAAERLEPLNCQIIKDYSAQAVRRFPYACLDFVYIDANRTFGSVTENLTLWSERVKPGGVICGCCYYNFRDRSICEVKDAVGAFTAERDIDPWFVLVHHRYPCYLWEKP